MQAAAAANSFSRAHGLDGTGWKLTVPKRPAIHLVPLISIYRSINLHAHTRHTGTTAQLTAGGGPDAGGGSGRLAAPVFPRQNMSVVPASAGRRALLSLGGGGPPPSPLPRATTWASLLLRLTAQPWPPSPCLTPRGVVSTTGDTQPTVRAARTPRLGRLCLVGRGGCWGLCGWVTVSLINGLTQFEIGRPAANSDSRIDRLIDLEIDRDAGAAASAIVLLVPRALHCPASHTRRR